MDSDSGKVIDAIDTEGGVDEVVFDVPSKRIYYTGTTASWKCSNRLTRTITSVWEECDRADCETTLLVPELKRFYAAIPKLVILVPPIPQSKEATIEEAKILVYDVMP